MKTDPGTGHHLFRCSAGGCRLKGTSKLQRYCEYEVWEDPKEQPRIVGILPRANPSWDRIYKMRMGIERIFRSLKHRRNLGRHCFRGMTQNLLHTTLSMLTYSATALARRNIGDERRMRLMRVNAS